MTTATLSSKGQITIPKEVRERLGIVRGDVLEFVLASDGSVELRPVVHSVRELAGVLRRPGRAATPDEMDEDLVDLLSAEDERIRTGR